MLPLFKLRLNKLWTAVTGRPEKFSLESRIFHTLSIFALLLLVFEFFWNLNIGLAVSAILTLFVLLFQCFLYYLSRFENKLTLAVILSAIEATSIEAYGYFYNAGITGATLILFAGTLFMLISVSKKSLWPFMLLFNVGVVLCVVLYEYHYPHSIKQNYPNRAAQFADNIASYFVTIAIIYIGTAFIRRSYTQQKHIADEKALALELLNAEKVKLFSIIAHDLRAPLASVQQYFKVMSSVDTNADERAEMESNLQSTINSTQELLNNLLKWARNQMDGSIVSLKALPLNDYLQETTDLFKVIAEKKDIELTTSASPDITVYADQDMLQLVIRNLLNNAVKFTPAGGKITLLAIMQGANCIISIKDTGIGIPKDRHADIFTLNTITTNGTSQESGTGLGLVLCKDYTELQGGKIWFTSDTGKGSTFFVSLPLMQPRFVTA